jgi:hypothetical protein
VIFTVTITAVVVAAAAVAEHHHHYYYFRWGVRYFKFSVSRFVKWWILEIVASIVACCQFSVLTTTLPYFSDPCLHQNTEPKRGEIHADWSKIQTTSICKKCDETESNYYVLHWSWKIYSVSEYILSLRVNCSYLIKFIFSEQTSELRWWEWQKYVMWLSDWTHHSVGISLDFVTHWVLSM